MATEASEAPKVEQEVASAATVAEPPKEEAGKTPNTAAVTEAAAKPSEPSQTTTTTDATPAPAPATETSRTTPVSTDVNGVKQTDFPSNVFFNIVAHLAEHQDQCNLMLVCKKWSKSVAEAMYHAPPLQSSDSFERLMGLLNTPLPFHPYPSMIRKLDISGIAADNLYMGDLDAALSMCPNIEVFRLENCYHISNILVQSLSHHCPKLKQVDLPGCPVSDSFIPALTKNCKQLEQMDLSFTNLTVASLHPIVDNCESLIKLDLCECRDADDGSLKLDFSNRFTRTLKQLNLRNTPITDELLRYIAERCVELEFLTLESCPKITDAGTVAVARHCSKLKRLDLSFCDRITDVTLQEIALQASRDKDGKGLRGNLEQLYLSACDVITAQGVLQVAQQCTKLQLLVLDGCERILGTFVQQYATYEQEELECTLEREAIRKFAAHSSGTNAAAAAVANTSTPPATPERVDGSPNPADGGLAPPAQNGPARPTSPTPFKVEVTYATGRPEASEDPTVSEEEARRAAAAAVVAANHRTNSKFAANIIRSVLGPNDPNKPMVSEPESHHQKLLNRKASKSMLLRKKGSRASLVGDDNAGPGDDFSPAEQARLERQEKIREKRRSRVPDEDMMIPGVFPSSSNSSFRRDSFTGPTKMLEKRASMSRLRDYALGGSGGSPTPPEQPGPLQRPSWDQMPPVASNWANAPGLPSQQQPPSVRTYQWSSGQGNSAPSDPWSQSQSSGANWAAAGGVAGPTPPASPSFAQSKADRRRSAPVPQRGASFNDFSSALGGAVGGPHQQQQPAGSNGAAAGEGGILLASGRHARTSSMSAPSLPDVSEAGGASPEGGRVLIASGRRRRTGSTASSSGNNTSPSSTPTPGASSPTPPSTNSASPSAAANGSAGNGDVVSGKPSAIPTTTGAQPSASESGWGNPAPTAKPAAWGKNPEIWTNPAQLISASSTWAPSNNPAAAAAAATLMNPSGGAMVGGGNPMVGAGSAFVDPWAKAPQQQQPPQQVGGGFGGLGNGMPNNDPWAAPPQQPPQQSGFGGGMGGGMGGSGWGSNPLPTPIPSQPPQQQPSNIRMAAAAGWGNSGGMPPHHQSQQSYQNNYNQQQQQPPQQSGWGSGPVFSPPPQQQNSSSYYGGNSPAGNKRFSMGPGPMSGMRSSGGWNDTASMSGSAGGGFPGSNMNMMGPGGYGNNNNGGMMGGGPGYGNGMGGMGAGQVGGMVGVAGGAASGAGAGGFVYSQMNRGRMLLKLKIETKNGGHQTLAVHELDDPHQLAAEFCAYWDMAAFREPLVRLISVRKTNALRQRGGTMH
ncbi:SCF ubiquitin ligase complex subunit [Quaeritorhiza haematococci]|nr:SCF ubiquitin ligase complex subunit [Quaeritorhiza haematococci]